MSHVQTFLERPRLYYNIDGMGELNMGIMCLGFAALGWLQLRTAKTSVWHEMVPVLLYLGILTAILHFGTKAIKKHITFRRTGFVEYRHREQYRAMGIAVAVSVLVVVVVSIAARRQWDLSTPVSLFGLVVAAVYIRSARTVRWKWAVFWSMVAGSLAIAVLPEDWLDALAGHASLTPAIPASVMGAYWLTFTVYGVLLTVSGAISFWLYLRHTQAPEQEGP